MKVKKLTKRIAALLVFCMLLAFFPGKLITAEAETNVIRVTTALELMQAMRNASPGDEIVVAPGEYVGALGTGANGSGYGSAWFYGSADGTADQPITVRAEDPDNRPLLKGSRTNGMTMYITGDYWVLDGLDLSVAQKGLILDNSSYSIIRNCDIHYVAMEGLHLRDGSSYNLVENCKVYDTGLVNKGMGEGVYIGSDKGKWGEFNKECNYNIIRSCELGPGVDSEHVDIKEGTVGTVIEYCVMHGAGISGGNYADSFIDAKGNNSIIRYNVCYQEGNDIIVDAFQTHQQIDDCGTDNVFIYNTVNLTNSAVNIVNGVNNAAAFAYGNTSNLDVNEAVGNVTMLTKEEADRYAEGASGEITPPAEPEEAVVSLAQVDAAAAKHRVVYSVSDPNGEVVQTGLIYCIDAAVAVEQMVAGGENVYTVVSTSAGLLPQAEGQDASVSNYAMTMTFSGDAAFAAGIRFRAYVLLASGEYIYSEVK